MLKVITSVLFVAVLFVSLGVDAATLLSGVTGIIDPRGQLTSPKGDRLPTRPAGPDCSKLPWPYYEANCLRGLAQQGDQPRSVRVIAIERPAAKRPSSVN